MVKWKGFRWFSLSPTVRSGGRVTVLISSITFSFSKFCLKSLTLTYGSSFTDVPYLTYKTNVRVVFVNNANTCAIRSPGPTGER